MNTLNADSFARRGSIFTKLLIFAVALAATFALMWILLLPSIVTGLVKKHTGFNASVKSLYVNPFTASVAVKQFNIDNPETFPTKEFISLNEFDTKVEAGSVFSDRVVVDNAVIDVAYVDVVKNAQGKINLDAFRAGLHPQTPPNPNDKNQPQPGGQAENPSPSKQFLIHHLVIRLEKIVVADYSGPEPKIREIPIRLDRTFTDVTNLAQISGPIVADLSVAGVGNLAGSLLGVILPAPVLHSLGIMTKDTGSLLKGTGKKTKDLIKGLFDSLEEKPKQ